MIPNVLSLIRYMWLHYPQYSDSFIPVAAQSVTVDYVGDTKVGSVNMQFAEVESDGRRLYGDVLFYPKMSDWNSVHSSGKVDCDSISCVIVNVADMPNCSLTTLVMRCIVSQELLQRVMLKSNAKGSVCVSELSRWQTLYRRSLFESLLFERLETKAKRVLESYCLCSDWNRLYIKMLFTYLRPKDAAAKPILIYLADNPYLHLVVQEAKSKQEIEGFIFGLLGLLNCDGDNSYLSELQEHYSSICKRYSISSIERFNLQGVQLSKLYLGVAQLSAMLYNRVNFATHLYDNYDINSLYKLLSSEVSPYWKSHTDFSACEAKVSRSLNIAKWRLDIFIINAIVPMNLAMHKILGVIDSSTKDSVIELMLKIKSENNHIVTFWQGEGMKIDSAYESQALNQLQSEYCDKGRCIECSLL